jgi:oligopeptide/dipeptide ABC transporter ATP-binding protein
MSQGAGSQIVFEQGTAVLVRKERQDIRMARYSPRKAQSLRPVGGHQTRLGVSYLFIAHDLAVVSHLSHQTAVMYLGKLVEVANSLELCSPPLHPYTKALFAASLPSHPDEEREEIVLSGEVPSALNPPQGAGSIRAAPLRCRAARKRSRC